MDTEKYIKSYLDLQEDLQSKSNNTIPVNNTGVGNLVETITLDNIPKDLDLHLRCQIKNIPINSTPSQPDYGYPF